MELANKITEKDEMSEFVFNMREASGLSREEIAHYMCLHVNTVVSIERGEKLPPHPALFVKYLRIIVKNTIEARRFVPAGEFS